MPSKHFWDTTLPFKLIIFLFWSSFYHNFAGFSTAKGELVRSILHPKPIGFQFYKDAMRFIMFLACIATLGMAYSIVVLVQDGVSASLKKLQRKKK